MTKDGAPRLQANACLRGVACALLAFTAFSLAGCDTIMVATGLRMRLDGVPLASVAAALPGDGRLGPGGSARLSVVATTTDGRTLATVGTGDGKVLADSYVYEASVVTVDAKGVVRLPADPRLSEGLVGHVRLHAVGQAIPVADIDIPVRYDLPFATTFAGRDGMDGTNGIDGMSGFDGANGSADPNSPSPGAGGSNGQDGGNGGDGSDGAPGPDVQVAVALAPGAHPLLRVRASTAGDERFFEIDPSGGSLSLVARGGHGGDGGRGGSGGRGGHGGSGSAPGSDGLPGQDGRDGWPGRGGQAGQVHVTVDPAAAPWLDRLHLENEDGDGRPGPAPSVTIAPVASPW